jgi:very-short-patch-repair endonuclease
MSDTSSIALMIAIVTTLMFLCMVFKPKKRVGFENSKKLYSDIKRKKILTVNEKPVYFDLVKACPSHLIVLCQVSFNSMITTRNIARRNEFNRAACDYCLCDKDFNPVLIIELDDRSHLYNKERDLKRDTLLNSAGIPVIRFSTRPSISDLKKAIKNAI